MVLGGGSMTSEQIRMNINNLINQKINIDMATYHTNQITLLNLDNYSNTMLSI